MTRTEFMSGLRQALSGLPDEERANALRYYEEYFDDAGPEHEEEAASNLGDPKIVAEQILADFRELAAAPKAGGSNTGSAPPNPGGPNKKRKGINPILLIMLVLLAIPVGIPLLVIILGLLFAVAAVFITVGIVIAAIPVCLIAAGGAFSVFSFFVWNHPASALVTLGSGLGLLGAGALAALLLIKLCILFVPPLFRLFIAVLRWPIDKLRSI